MFAVYMKFFFKPQSIGTGSGYLNNYATGSQKSGLSSKQKDQEAGLQELGGLTGQDHFQQRNNMLSDREKTGNGLM